MHRRPTTQDISWILDLRATGRLDLSPPYQRRSVWTRADKLFFLDTIFRNFPSPAIFLHKTTDENGKTIYHVVDGKQRIQTILDFVDGNLRISKSFGDARLDGKKWSDLAGEPQIRQAFWNYQMTVEMIDFSEGTVVREVFDRLNRNARRLTSQELRHAKFDGWFIQRAEEEIENDDRRESWRELGIFTPSRNKRMVDTQFISELMLIILEKRVIGFDQDDLDELYAKYDEIDEDSAPEGFNEEVFETTFSRSKEFLLRAERERNIISRHATSLANFYSLWAILSLNNGQLEFPEVCDAYEHFMGLVSRYTDQGATPATPTRQDALAIAYLANLRGASTDAGPRKERFVALFEAVFGRNP